MHLGHCFRCTSTSILANAGASSRTIKRHWGWKSEAVAERYIRDSIRCKKTTGNIILSAISGRKTDIENVSLISKSKQETLTSKSKQESSTFKSKPKSAIFEIENESSQFFLSFAENLVKSQSKNEEITNSQLSNYVIEEDEYIVENNWNNVVDVKPNSKFKFRQPMKFKNCTVNFNYQK